MQSEVRKYMQRITKGKNNNMEDASVKGLERNVGTGVVCKGEKLNG